MSINLVNSNNFVPITNHRPEDKSQFFINWHRDFSELFQRVMKIPCSSSLEKAFSLFTEANILIDINKLNCHNFSAKDKETFLGLKYFLSKLQNTVLDYFQKNLDRRIDAFMQTQWKVNFAEHLPGEIFFHVLTFLSLKDLNRSLFWSTRAKEFIHACPQLIIKAPDSSLKDKVRALKKMTFPSKKAFKLNETDLEKYLDTIFSQPLLEDNYLKQLTITQAKKMLSLCKSPTVLVLNPQKVNQTTSGVINLRNSLGLVECLSQQKKSIDHIYFKGRLAIADRKYNLCYSTFKFLLPHLQKISFKKFTLDLTSLDAIHYEHIAQLVEFRFLSKLPSIDTFSMKVSEKTHLLEFSSTYPFALQDYAIIQSSESSILTGIFVKLLCHVPHIQKLELNLQGSLSLKESKPPEDNQLLSIKLVKNYLNFGRSCFSLLSREQNPQLKEINLCFSNFAFAWDSKALEEDLKVCNLAIQKEISLAQAENLSVTSLIENSSLTYQFTRANAFKRKDRA